MSRIAVMRSGVEYCWSSLRMLNFKAKGSERLRSDAGRAEIGEKDISERSTSLPLELCLRIEELVLCLLTSDCVVEPLLTWPSTLDRRSASSLI